MSIIYSKLSGKNDALYGKFEHPIKALIQNESNAYEKNKSLLDVSLQYRKVQPLCRDGYGAIRLCYFPARS